MNVDISVVILTYYHEKYIKQAIESVLSQKTTYNFEIVVSDDASQDKTPEILKEYERKYPKKIRVNYNLTNIGIPNNIYLARSMCRGKYIVLLAGDDYWINENKLQIQGSFLDNNQEYVAVCSRLEIRYDNDSNGSMQLPEKSETNKEYTLLDFEQGKNMNTHGLMMRNFFLTEEGRMYFGTAREISEKVDDAVDNLLILRRGRVFTLNVLTDVYRVPRKSMSGHSYGSRTDFEKATDEVNLYNGLYKRFNSEVEFRNRYIKSTGMILKGVLTDRGKKKWFGLYKQIPLEYRKIGKKNIVFLSILTFIKQLLKKLK